MKEKQHTTRQERIQKSGKKLGKKVCKICSKEVGKGVCIKSSKEVRKKLWKEHSRKKRRVYARKVPTN